MGASWKGPWSRSMNKMATRHKYLIDNPKHHHTVSQCNVEIKLNPPAGWGEHLIGVNGSGAGFWILSLEEIYARYLTDINLVGVASLLWTKCEHLYVHLSRGSHYGPKGIAIENSELHFEEEGAQTGLRS